MKRLAALLACSAFLGACQASDGPLAPTGRAMSASFNSATSKVSICHVTGNGSYHEIDVAAAAVPAHLAHGDVLVGPAPDHSGVYDASCTLTQIALDPTTTVSTVLGGGGGGNAFNDACPAGSVAVGIAGDRVNYYGSATISSYQLLCAPLLADGTLGATTTVTPPRGPVFSGSPQNQFSVMCPSGQVLVGLTGAQSGFVSSVTGECAPVATVLAGGSATSQIGPFVSTSGFVGNSTYDASCPSGFVATGSIGRAGDILDGVGLSCTKIVVN